MGLSPESVRPKGANGKWTVGTVKSWSPSLTWARTSPDGQGSPAGDTRALQQH